jgi:hypothetical protein
MDVVIEKLQQLRFPIHHYQITSLEMNPCVPVLKAKGSEALLLWSRLRELVDMTGHWPVLLGTDDEMASLSLDIQEREKSVQELLDLSMNIEPDPKVWSEQRFMQWSITLQKMGMDTSAWNHSANIEDWLEEEDNVKIDSKNIQDTLWHIDFTIPVDTYRGEERKNVLIGLMPGTSGCDVPAWLNWGGWNTCPLPEQHVAMFRYWQKNYGAELVGITHDVIEMNVRRPPHTESDSFRLAQMQYEYCPDIVDQNARSCRSLARSLQGSRVWHFWWD